MLHQLFDRLRQFPWLRFTIPLLLGIVLEGIVPSQQHYLLLGIALVFLFLAAFLHPWQGYSNRWIVGVAINLFLCAGGYWLAVEAREEPPYPDNYSGFFILKIREMPEEKERSFRLKAYLVSELRNDSLYFVGQEILLYIKKESRAANLMPGDEMLANVRLQKPANALNPGDFDYRNYLAVHGTYYTAFLNLSQAKLLHKSSEFSLTIFLRNLRGHLIQKLPDYGITGNNLAIFSALTLGYTGYLDTETRNDFVASGAMHVLSVSGLHVAIVFLLFSYMLGFTSRSIRYVRLRATIVIILLWVYACLTGLPPSVLRSTIMFCIVVGARVFKKRSNIYNSVAISAFLLMLFDPLVIYDIGFQLSYMALLSIVYFQPILLGLFHFKTWIIQKAWELTAVSFAAQIATTPISIAVFGQFPIYFWVSNIFVIFLSTILLYVAAPFGLLAYFAPFVGRLVGQGLSYLLDGLRYITNFVEQLPGSVVTGLHLNGIQAMLLVFSVIMVGFYRESRQKLCIALVLVSVGAVVLIDSMSIINHKQQQVVAILSVRNGKAIAFVHGQTAMVLWSGKEMDSLAIGNALRAPMRYYRIKTINLQPLEFLNDTVRFPLSASSIAGESILIISYAGKRIAIQKNKPSFYLNKLPPKERLEVDVLYSDNYYLAKIAMNVILPKTVVLGKMPSQQSLANTPTAELWPLPSNGAYLLSIKH